MNARNACVCDAINLILGIALFGSLWIAGYVPGAASYNIMFTALAIEAVAIAAIEITTSSVGGLNLIIGLWLVISPWILGYQDLPALKTISVVIGFVVAASAALMLVMRRRPEPAMVRQTI